MNDFLLTCGFICIVAIGIRMVRLKEQQLRHDKIIK